MKFKKILLNIKAKYFSSYDAEYSKCNCKTANLFAALALIFGIILIYINPPMVCPDENAHYINICRIAGGRIFADVSDGNVGSIITQDQADFVYEYNGRYQGLETDKYTFSNLYYLSHLNYSGSQKVFFETTLSTINPMSYLIQASGVFIAQRLFHVTSPYNILIWAKLANLFFFTFVTRLAIIKTPVLKNTMFMIALMPMTIYQCSSASYDCALIACSFLLFAYASRLILATEDYRVTVNDIFAVCFSCAFIFSSKIAYAPLVLLLLAVNYKKFGNKKKYFFCIFMVITMFVIFYFLPTTITNYITSECSPDMPILAQQKEYVKSHLQFMPAVIIKTTLRDLQFWVASFFGILGGLDINYPQPFIYLYLLMLLISAITELSIISKVGMLPRVLSLMGITTFFIGTATAMYIEWTPMITGEVGGDYFTGIQGRYFIPIALYGLIIFANPLLKHFKFLKNILNFQAFFSKNMVIGYLCLTCLVLLTKLWI